MAGPRVLIFGKDHPHKGATGFLTEEVVQPQDGGPQMARVDLEETTPSGVTSCYAEGADLMPVTFSYEPAGSAS